MATFEEAFCPEEKTVLLAFEATDDLQVLAQDRLRPPRPEPEVLAPAFSIESHGDRDRFDQCRLAAAVLADQERHFRMQPKGLEASKGRQ